MTENSPVDWATSAFIRIPFVEAPIQINISSISSIAAGFAHIKRIPAIPMKAISSATGNTSNVQRRSWILSVASISDQDRLRKVSIWRLQSTIINTSTIMSPYTIHTKSACYAPLSLFSYAARRNHTEAKHPLSGVGFVHTERIPATRTKATSNPAECSTPTVQVVGLVIKNS